MLVRSGSRRRAIATQLKRRFDECQVRERLREISDLAFGLRIVLLSEQTNIIGELAEPFEQRLCVPPASQAARRRPQPE